jgi:hypothetical protein
MINTPKSFVLKHKIRKTVYKYKSSDPFLSVSFYQRISDYCVTDLKVIDNFKLKNARVLYVKAHLLDQLLLENWRSIHSKVLIVAGSDDSFRCIPARLPSQLKHIFAQNSLIPDNNQLSVIPIGMEPPHLGWNGVPKLMVNRNTPETRLHRVLVGPFGNTNPERLFTTNYLKSNEGPWDVYEQKMYPDAFADLHRKYKMTLCLTGNGLDTYRVWETLYRGGLPLVERNAWSLNMVRNGFPLEIIEVDNSTELEKFCATVEKFDYSNERILYTDYWKGRILEHL